MPSSYGSEPELNWPSVGAGAMTGAEYANPDSSVLPAYGLFRMATCRERIPAVQQSSCQVLSLPNMPRTALCTPTRSRRDPATLPDQGPSPDLPSRSRHPGWKPPPANAGDLKLHLKPERSVPHGRLPASLPFQLLEFQRYWMNIRLNSSALIVDSVYLEAPVIFLYTPDSPALLGQVCLELVYGNPVRTRSRVAMVVVAGQHRGRAQNRE